MTGLEKAKYDTFNAYQAKRNERDSLVRAATEEAKRKIELFYNGMYEAEVKRLWTEARTANEACEAETVANAKANKGAPWPVGTKLLQVHNRGRYNERTEYGILEVYTHDSVCQDNIRYGKPHIGAFVVRLLKADGTPSKKIDKIDTHHGYWTPIDPTIQHLPQEPFEI